MSAMEEMNDSKPAPMGNPLPRRSLSVVTVVILLGNAAITGAILVGVFPELREHLGWLALALLGVVGALATFAARLARRPSHRAATAAPRARD